LIVQPISTTCSVVYNKQEQVILGISPFNSYFSLETISYLVSWAKREFNSFYLYIPDKPTTFTLQALGYDEKKATKKARRQCNYLKNKMTNALKANGIAEENATDFIIDSNRLSNNAVYLEKLNHCFDLFDQDSDFQAGCLSSSRWVLESQLDDESLITEKALFKAAKYFLAELPLFLWSSEIMNNKSTLFGYHNCPEFLHQLFTDRPANLLSQQQGFSVIKPKKFTMNSL